MRRAVFFDDGRGRLSPLTDLRPSFDVRTGALTTLERQRGALGLEVAALFVQPRLAAVTAERHAGAAVNTLSEATDRESLLVLNGRCVPVLDVVKGLEPGCVVVQAASRDLIAACLEPGEAARLLAGDAPRVRETIEVEDAVLLERPWDVRRWRDEALRTDLALLAGTVACGPTGGALVIGDHGVIVHPEARVLPGAVLCAEAGPVVIDRGAEVRPLASVSGPAYVGPGSTVVEHAFVKAGTAIGPVCKVGGEVGGTIFQGHANKAHDGHLGDSWVGEWVNIGAGATNSNLLNTYTEVAAVAAPGMGMERTGEVFLGAVLGDHTKLAIGTRVMTGAVVHTGVMYAASAPVSGCVGPFSWVTDGGRRLFRLSRFEETARAVMGRRGVRPTEAYTGLLRSLHAEAERA